MKLKLPRLLPRRPPPPSEPAFAAPPGSPLAAADRALHRLEWTVLRRLDGLVQADVRTLMRGNGVDLADLREYQPHDDVRRIDWNVTARMQTPHVRDYHEDRDMTVWFLVDGSASIDFGSGERSKHALAREFVAVLARVFTKAGHRVGLVMHRGGDLPDVVLPARGGRAAVLQIMATLATPRPEPARGSIPAGLTQLQRLLQAGDRNLRRRCSVFVVSDFISTPGWERALGQLTLRHDVLAVRLVDPWERSLPDLGLLTLRDAETGEQVQVDLSDPGFRRRFATLSGQRAVELESLLVRAGVDALELETDGDLLDALQRYARLRRLRQRRSSGPASGWANAGRSA